MAPVRRTLGPVACEGGDVDGLDIDEHGGGTLTLADGSVLAARARTRHRERWLATPPLPPDVAPDGPAVAARTALLAALVARAEADGATEVHWETDDAEAPVDAIAAAVGLPVRRDVLQMRRPLPLEPDLVAAAPVVALRPLRPGTADEAAWVRCNNRSFADHPDQGQETVASLRASMAEPWFEAAGLLLADGSPPVDEGGDLDGFCWTRVHPATDEDPALGEIYVIGIDPSAGGRALGTSLTVAGLVHLAGRGTPVGLLYVEADNAPARRLYDRLGFTVHGTRRVRSRRLGPQTTS